MQKQPFLVLTHLEAKVVISFLNQTNHWSLHSALELYRKCGSDHKWQANGGTFYPMLEGLGDAEWEQMRAMIKGTNAKDKADRATG